MENSYAPRASWRKTGLKLAFWTVGCLVVIPAFMAGFPYIVGMGWEKYGLSPMGFLKESVPAFLLLWIAGILLGGLLHFANRFTPSRAKSLVPNNSEPETSPHRLSAIQLLVTTIGLIMYGYLAFICTAVLISSAIWLGVIVGVFFAILGGLALRQHLALSRRS